MLPADKSGSAPLVVGVDRWAGRWVAVALRGGAFACASVFAAMPALLDAFADAAAIGVDIPIGLPLSGRRACDVAAARLLGPRRSSVFATPAREILDQPFRAGLGVSAQAHALRGAITEVAPLAAAAAGRVFEVHPEVSFLSMAGAPLPHRKKSWSGMWQRLRLLDAEGIRLPRRLGEAGLAAADDLLDAAAAAWTAARYARGEARCLPDGATGGEPVIWY
ncbi:MAG TPA: DUF429 domain-containing protein [Candidatus Dormibacteraeota bacterium]